MDQKACDDGAIGVAKGLLNNRRLSTLDLVLTIGCVSIMQVNVGPSAFQQNLDTMLCVHDRQTTSYHPLGAPPDI